jgi:hypothetical protein
MAEPRHPDIDFEKTDIRGTPVLRFVIALGIAMVVVGFLLLAFYRTMASYLAARQPPPPVLQFDEERKPPLPRLQPDPPADLAKVRAEEADRLKSYGWIDKDAGVVHIPLDQAMKIALERGLVQGPASAGVAKPAETKTATPNAGEARKE